MRVSSGTHNEEYIEPDVLFAEVTKEMQSVSDVEFFNNPKYKNLKEKWCGAAFGLGYKRYLKACNVRMEPQQDNSADFYLLTNQNEYPFQSTMAVKEGRKMGKEYKDRERNLLSLSPYRPGEGAIKGSKWICEAVQKKVNEHYSNAKELNLLVYANFEADNYDRNEIIQALNLFKDEFASIWVITNHAIASIFTNNDLGQICDFKTIQEILPPAFVQEQS